MLGEGARTEHDAERYLASYSNAIQAISRGQVAASPETAAVLKQLDLVIMTDSSVAHLAGSIGVPVWNLLPTRAYWIYLLERGDSPWYPSMRLFRQTEPGDWDSVFKKAAVELGKAVALKKSGKWT